MLPPIKKTYPKAKKKGKKNLFYRRRDSKKWLVGWLAQFFFFFTFCCQNYPQKALKSLIFSCSLGSQFFIQIFAPKQLTLQFSLLKNKQTNKNQQIGISGQSVLPVEQVFCFVLLFFPRWLKQVFFFLFLLL